MAARETYLDNAKGLLIVLVVLGHLVWPVPGPDRLNQALYAFIYLFHMPMFALVSGYLSRPRSDRPYLLKMTMALLGPYVAVELVHYGLALAYHAPFRPLNGDYGLWYLLSLLSWRLLLPVCARMRGSTVLALTAALACGYIDWIELPLSASRTLVFFPCFLVGFQLRSREADLRSIVSATAAGGVLVGCAVLCWFFAETRLLSFLWGCFPYKATGVSAAYGPGLRLVRIALACGAGLSVMALIPVRRSILTGLGRNCLTVYLLHSPLLLIYRQYEGIHGPLNAWPLILVVPAACTVSLLLGSDALARQFHFLTSPAAELPRLWQSAAGRLNQIHRRTAAASRSPTAQNP